MIARAVYKNPDYLFFDEATNALDANNEREIMEHLYEFYKGKTVVVVAHRLSTVRDADNIIVLDKGKIAQKGTHRKLTEQKGAEYFIDKRLQLGELQAVYASFMIAFSDYIRFVEQDYYTKKLNAGRKQFRGQRSYLNLVQRGHALTKRVKNNILMT